MDLVSVSVAEWISLNLIPLAATILSILVIYYHIRAFTFWSSRGIPGPTPWPIVGTNGYYMFRNKVQVDMEWRQKYGRTYGIYEGYDPTLRTTDSELIKFVWIKNFQSFTDRNTRFIFGQHIRRWLFFSHGSHWTSQRALMTPMFTSLRMKRMFSMMSDAMRRFGKLVETRLSSSSDSIKTDEAEHVEGVGFDRNDLLAMGLDVISSAFFGIRLDTYRDKASDFCKRAFAFARFDFGWFLIWMFIPTPIARYFEIDLTRYSKYEYFDKLSQRNIDERRKNPALAKDDFIQELMNAKLPEVYETVYSKEDDKEAIYNDEMDHKDLEQINKTLVSKAKFRMFSDLEIRAQMTFLFLAGFETTSNSLTFCIYALAHQQELQEELYQEVKELPEFSGQQGYQELQSAVKLDAFISETLRIYSTVTEHNRMVTAEGGIEIPTSPPIRIPKGTVISVNGYVLQHDPEYWPKPENFDITRFYPENRANIRSCSYVPFGVGPRNCAGMRFALLTMKTFLATLLKKYRIRQGTSSYKYPPEFKSHAFFLQFKEDDFKLVTRT